MAHKYKKKQCWTGRFLDPFPKKTLQKHIYHELHNYCRLTQRNPTPKHKTSLTVCDLPCIKWEMTAVSSKIKIPFLKTHFKRFLQIGHSPVNWNSVLFLCPLKTVWAHYCLCVLNLKRLLKANPGVTPWLDAIFKQLWIINIRKLLTAKVSSDGTKLHLLECYVPDD